MKSLFISYDGMTDPLGQSQVLPYLFGLSKAGHDISLLSFEKEERFKKSGEQIQILCTANNIDWHPLSYTKKPPVVSTLLDIRKGIKKATALHSEKKFDIIHCRSYIAALIGKKMKKKYQTKMVFDMRGFWADERVDGGLWKLNNPLYAYMYRYFKKKEIDFLNLADHTISLTQNAADEIHSWKKLKHQPVPITVIPCCADLKLFNRNNVSIEEIKSLKNKLGIGLNDFVLSYVGSLGTWYMLDEMLDFFKQLLIKKPKAKLLFITNDPGENILVRAIEKNIPKESVIITNAQRNQMPLYISLSDYNLFFVKPAYSKKASSPVKMGEAMGMGIPLICNIGVGDVDAIINKSQSGFVVNEFTLNEYNRVIEELSNTIINQQNILNGAEEFYSLEKGIEKYLHVYNALK